MRTGNDLVSSEEVRMTAHNALELGQTTSARSYRPTVPLACGKTLHFGLNLDKSRVSPANELGAHLTMPAAAKTWKAIQSRAENNSRSYNQTFNSIPQNISQTQDVPDSLRSQYPNGFPASVWPTWVYTDVEDFSAGGRLAAPIPLKRASGASLSQC